MDCFKIEENKGLIRYLNVLPSQQAVDIYVDNKLLYSDIKYKDFTPYVYMENRPYKIDINEEIKSQIKASLEALVQNSEDWQFVRSAQSYDIIANQDAFIFTNIDNLSSEEECECFELVGQNTKSKIERIGAKLYLSCNNPITFPKKMFNGSVIYVVSPTIHIEEGQIVGIMRKTPKLDDNKPMTLGLTLAPTED